MPFVEIARIVVCRFLFAPHVESFVHNHQAEAVAKFEQFGRGVVVGAANGVGAHFFHYHKLALYGTAVDYRAECPGIMVEAHTVDFHIPAVEEKSVFVVKFHCAESESRVYGVYTFFGVEIKYAALHSVQLRVADIP